MIYLQIGENMTQQMQKTQEATSSQAQIRNVRIQKMNNLRERGLKSLSV